MSIGIRLVAGLGLVLAAASAPAEPLSRAEAYGRAADLAALGQALFFDPALSASGRQSCAGCHDPAHGFGPANALAVQPGGPAMDRFAGRAAPTLSYTQAVPQFTEHFHESDDEGDESVDAGPTGGLTWDGRVDRKRDQARIPLLASAEMANASPAEVVARLRDGPYAEPMRRLGGADILDDPGRAFALLTEALETFQQTPSLFYPYSSKYDAVLAGKARLSPREQRGLEVFEDPETGNCASCHPSRPAGDGAAPQFSDWGFVALGLPRNREIPANADPAHADLGLCGPDRADLADHPEYCGAFRTPSLRNVALKQSFFHNGVVHTVRDAVAFYAERDTRPETWYPRRPDGTVWKYDDLPPQYLRNVEVGVPFGQKAGEVPLLSDADVDALVAFLETLTDGYRPGPAEGPPIRN